MEAPEHSLRDSLAAALKELSEGRIASAERMSVDLLRSRPNDSAAHQLAATIALQCARYSEAEQWSCSCLGLRPGHAPVMLIAGRAARALGDIERARDWFSRANAAAPDRPEPTFLLCVTQLECGDPAAQDTLARVMRKFPRDSQGWSQSAPHFAKPISWKPLNWRSRAHFLHRVRLRTRSTRLRSSCRWGASKRPSLPCVRL